MNSLYEKVSANVENGGRGVGNTLEQYLINPLARAFAQYEVFENATITIQGIEFGDSSAELICEVE